MFYESIKISKDLKQRQNLNGRIAGPDKTNKFIWWSTSHDKTYYSNNNNSSKAIQFNIKEELIISS